MEALVAFGLACNVIQVVDASWKAYDTYTQFRQRGTTARADELQQSTQHLATCYKSLQNSLSNAPKFPLLQSGVNLTELSRKCIQSAEDLEKELKKIRLEPGPSRLSTWGKTIRAKWKSERIEALKLKVDEYAGVLNSTILVHLAQNLGTLAAQQTNLLDQLNDWQQNIYAEINAGNTAVANLMETTAEKVMAHSTLEHNVTRLHIERKLDDFSVTQKIQAKYDGFMESLYFPEMNQRQDTIEDAHAKTFEWIFDSTSHTERPWDNYLTWIQDDDPIYWVLGKAGSGKSTLMNFLVQDARTQEAFERKFANAHPFIITFFFWEAGVDLQKNQLGLLRSLIWQILKSMDASVSISMWSDTLREISPPVPTVWTQKQLRRSLEVLVQAVHNPVCLFLDGLDEFHGLEDELDAIRDIIGVFRDRQQTKICLASRPSTSLESLYKSGPKLRLQDLTESDMRQYVKDKLTKNLSADHPRQLPGFASDQMAELIDLVLTKAEGVFLWVRLVVESLVRGIRKDDYWQTLMERLEQMPQGIFNLYEHMWKRQRAELDQHFYAKETATYLQYVRQFPGCSLVSLAIACDEQLQELYLGTTAEWNVERLGEGLHLERLRRRILTCCVGFLEICEMEQDERFSENNVWVWLSEVSVTDLVRHPDTINRLFEIFQNHRLLRVRFLHRSGIEYLETESGKQLLQAQPLPEGELDLMKFKSDLVLITLCTIKPQPGTFNRQFYHPIYKPFQNHLDNNPEVACGLFVQLEGIFEKLKSLGFASSKWMTHRWQEDELLSSSGAREKDYFHAFIQFSHSAYTEHKLRSLGLVHDRDHLTHLLRICIGAREFAFHWPPASNMRLLLELGADPNQQMFFCPKKSDPMSLFTIWTFVAVLMAISEQWGEIMRPLLRAFIKAGADLNTWVQCLFTSGKSGYWQKSGYWHAISKYYPGDYGKPSLLLRVKVCDLIPRHLHVRISDPPLAAEAISDSRTVVAFAPPNTWCTLASERLELSGDIFERHSIRAHWLDGLDLSYQGSTDLVHDCDNPRYFDNGIDTLRAAGFCDDEIRGLPIPQTIWEDFEEGRGEIHDMNAAKFNYLLQQWD